MAQSTFHATAFVLNGLGILIEGKPGAGKSRLALALLQREGALDDLALLSSDALIKAPTRPASTPDGGWSGLIGDDQIHLRQSRKAPLAEPAMNLRGAIEVRGLGIGSVRWCSSYPIGLILHLLPTDELERVPSMLKRTVLGHKLPCVSLPIGDLAHQILMVDIARAALPQS